jgi:hypothetical protein
MPNLTVGMTPSFFSEGDNLFKAQLKCLSEQENKDFDVFVIDCHYSRRKDLIPQYKDYYKLNIIHIPYKPNLNIAKKFDCAIFNAPYMYSEAPRVVRLSCWRFVTPDFTKICSESPDNCDFYYNDCVPKNPEDAHPITNHSVSIWNPENDFIDWSAIPQPGEPGCLWKENTDPKKFKMQGSLKYEPRQIIPKSCYGNYMIFKKEWLELNGCDEVFSNGEHWEDQDFVIRARKYGTLCLRFPRKLYRLHHLYGNYSGRSNIPVDYTFKPPCDSCEKACLAHAPNRYDIKNRYNKGEIDIFEENNVWVCKNCYFACCIYNFDIIEALRFAEYKKSYKASIIPKYKIGRNLRILSEDMNRKSLQEKIEIYNDSWSNERYYTI